MQEVLQLQADKLTTAEKEACAAINATMAAFELTLSPASSQDGTSPVITHDLQATQDVMHALELCHSQPHTSEPKLSAIVDVVRKLQQDFSQLADERNATVAALTAHVVRYVPAIPLVCACNRCTALRHTNCCIGQHAHLSFVGLCDLQRQICKLLPFTFRAKRSTSAMSGRSKPAMRRRASPHSRSASTRSST